MAILNTGTGTGFNTQAFTSGVSSIGSAVSDLMARHQQRTGGGSNKR
jgi:hypothetical protein